MRDKQSPSLGARALEAIRRWPDVVAGVLPAIRDRKPVLNIAADKDAMRLIEARRFDEADALLVERLVERPEDRRLAVAYAFSAHCSGRYREGVVRWTRAREIGAAEPFCTVCLASNLRELGEHDAAQAVMDAELARYPNDLMVLTEAARLARERNRPRDSLAFWRRAITLAKPHPEWLQGYVQSLFSLGEIDRAERALRSARRQFPEYRSLLAVEGAIAVAREDWPKAVAFWTDYRRRFPDDSTGWEQLGMAIQGAAMSQSADAPVAASSAAPAPPALADIAIIEDEPMRRLVSRFESIGDSCEMGLVQRRYGAEPLGLLRWNDVGLDNLVTALEHGLVGMGDPANTRIMTAANGELFIEDRRWSLGMHTFLFAGHVNPDDVYKKLCRRVAYLRDKLIEDLGTAEKVFVYRSSGIDEADLRRLHRALRAFGPVTLLGAQPVNTPATHFPGRPVGEIDRLDDGLYIGFLDRPGSDALGNWNIGFDDWTSIFTKALAAVDERVTA